MSAAELEKVTEAWPPVSHAVRVPHSDTDYREMVELLDLVTDEVGEDENHPLASLMDVLGVLIQKYEDENVQRWLSNRASMKSKFTQRRFRAPKRSSCAMCNPQQRGWDDKNGATGTSDMAGKAVR